GRIAANLERGAEFLLPAPCSPLRASHRRRIVMTAHKFSRRTMLRGVGVTMALPWLESLNVWGDIARGAKTASEAPVRLAVVLGCAKSNPAVHKNYSMMYSSHISWSSPTTPTPLELYPALAFDRLFKDDVRRGDQSVLDAVLNEASDVRHRISAGDRRKLDEY